LTRGDAVDFAKDFIADPSTFKSDEMKRLDDLPVRAARAP
jgi:hypothetical protein